MKHEGTRRYRYQLRPHSACGLETWKLDIYDNKGDQLEWILGCTFWTEGAARQALMRYRDRVKRGLPLLGIEPEARTIRYEERI